MRRRLLAPRWTRTQFLNRALQRARATDTLVMSQPVFDEVCDVLHGAWLARFVDDHRVDGSA